MADWEHETLLPPVESYSFIFLEASLASEDVVDLIKEFGLSFLFSDVYIGPLKYSLTQLSKEHQGVARKNN